MIFQILYVVCCVCLFVNLLKKKKQRLSFQPPQLSGGYPVIGHAWKLVGDQKHALRCIESISKEAIENGGAVSLNLGPHTIYAVSDPDECMKIANECLGKDYYYQFAKPFLGNGLTTAEVPTWKKHRKMISPAFSQQNLNSFICVFNRQAKRLVSRFETHVDTGPFNVDKYVRLNSLESICMTSFGADIANLDGLHKDYLDAVDEILDIFTERFLKFWFHSDLLFSFSALKRRQDLCDKKIKAFSRAILAKRKAETAILTESNETDTFKPLMKYLLDISNGTEFYSEEEILYETNTMVGAGYDTTTVAITLLLMVLGTYRNIQEKVYAEIRQVFNDSPRDVEKGDFLKLQYLEAVIKETLRLYPIAPVVARRIAQDLQLKNYTLKGGTSVILLFWGCHRHPMWGPDVEEFKPERWLDGSSSSIQNVFAGFSLGRRGCIGKTFAMMSIKTVICHIIRNFKIEADIRNLEFKMHGTLRISSGQVINLQRR